MEKLNGREPVLITGGAGFIGSNLVCHLLQETGHPVIVLDDESLGDRRNIGTDGYEFIKADVRDQGALAEVLERVDVIVHLAANTRVMDSIDDPAYNFDVNVNGTFHLFDLAREAGIKKIVFASTGGAILGEAEPPINEDMVARPLSPYGASKLAAEGYASAFSAAFDLPVTCLRFSNIYGPLSFHKGSVVAHFFKRLLAREPLVVYGDGSQTRDFLYVRDLMQGIVRAIRSDGCGVFQLGSGRPTSVNELLAAMRSVLADEFRSDVRYEDFRAGEIRHTWCNIDRARNALGFDPATPLLDGLQATWEWFVTDYAARGDHAA